MKKYYRITAKLLSPLIIQQKRQSAAPQTLAYLPGSTLRGAVAASYLRTGKKPEDKVFRNLFLEQPVHFPNLLPGPFGDTFSQILPTTVISCKREPGFNKHGVFDTLAVTTASRIENNPPDKALWKCSHHYCGKICGEDMKPFSGFWNGNPVSPDKFEPNVISHRSTGIDRTTGTIAASMFFMTQAIAEFYKSSEQYEANYYPQYLSGGMYLNEEQLNLLKPLVEDSIFAGADRTRGFGELAVSLQEVNENEHPQERIHNIENWSNSFKKKLKILTGKDQAPGIYFSIKLESHAILTDRFLRPVSEIEELIADNIVPVVKIANAENIRGWQSSWGLARPDETGISMGSV
ncbi:hypothetical protein QUF70_16110, partial [Desulfobacterales bacterium HSG17]|nr:hypothetical protein [Desulfobacterales bacterium HSG17]